MLSKFCCVLAITMATLASGVAIERVQKVYYQEDYPADHWAMQPKTWDDSSLIAFGYHGDLEYAVYLNPTDRRGYRCIVTLINSGDIASTFNRDYTSQERQGLGLLIHLMADAYSRIVPIAQTAVAGNNSHSFDALTGVTYIGNPQEPSILHGHVFGRGNPNEEYVEGIALGGPEPGPIFNMRATSPDVTGNDTKIRWADGEHDGVVERLREEIERVKTSYEVLGLTVITSSNKRK